MIARCGNTYSSEWFWSKIWHCFRTAPEVFEAAYSWVELSDWVPSVLCGVTDPRAIRRGICAAGHKALYAEDLGGLPDMEFLGMLDPALAELRDRLYDKAFDASEKAGNLCADWASRLGLRVGIPVAIGEMDVHYGAVGSGVAEGVMVKVIGTSSCDCGVLPADREILQIPGICGIVRGALLTSEAAALAPGESGLLALDWNNGNRTVLVDQRLTGLLLGQTLHTTRAKIYRALIEATAFGAGMILERLREYGVEISKIVCAGGVAEKNPLLLQIYADVTGSEMAVARSAQACALGAAVAAAVVAGPTAGGHQDFATAQAAMTGFRSITYRPHPAASATYTEIFNLYRAVHDAFGGVNRAADLRHVMKELLAIKERVCAAKRGES